MPARETYDPGALSGFLAALFRAQGLPEEMAAVVARGFLEADLLGYPTHGVNRVPANLRWLRDGETDPTGEPEVRSDRVALANWDAHRLPGHWAMHRAVHRAIRGARLAGTFTLTMRRCQHVACVAATLVPVVESGLVALAMVSSPDEAFVSPFGSSERRFSNNPLAFTAPATGGPILFDVSMAITAGGQVARAARLGRPLPEPTLALPDGSVSSDPAALERGAAILPMGGRGHGHKGFALTLMTEVLTQALAGYGRARSSGDSEQNSVFLMVLDPAAFTDRADYDREIDHLIARVEGSRPDDPARPVRLPGRRAWLQRARQLEQGVSLDPGILAELVPFAEAAGVALPAQTAVR
ncbi:MAG: Ldh family oxidoreductase [Pseudomonadales bacterium]